jgi:hypothetical protein
MFRKFRIAGKNMLVKKLITRETSGNDPSWAKYGNAECTVTACIKVKKCNPTKMKKLKAKELSKGK